MNIHVHIDELVLHGFAPGVHARIAESVQSQLARMFMESGAPPAIRGGGRVDRLNGGSFQVGAAARPETTGAQIARAVYGGLGTWAND
jgi:hypothetical protein